MSERLTIQDIADDVQVLAQLEADTYILTTGADFERIRRYILLGHVGLYVDNANVPRARLKKSGVTALQSGRAHLAACGLLHP